jgi:CrcB protein
VILYIIGGGIVGTVSRWYLQGWIQERSGLATFPLGTVGVNLLGSFVIAFVIRFATGSVVLSPQMRAGLTTGFCGAFTTMSTFAYESVRLLADGEYGLAALYMSFTIAGCVGAVIAGTVLAERLL